MYYHAEKDDCIPCAPPPSPAAGVPFFKEAWNKGRFESARDFGDHLVEAAKRHYLID